MSTLQITVLALISSIALLVEYVCRKSQPIWQDVNGFFLHVRCCWQKPRDVISHSWNVSRFNVRWLQYCTLLHASTVMRSFEMFTGKIKERFNALI